MSFIVSNSFISCETIEGVTYLELFQRLKPIRLKPTLNQPPITSCSTVSVVSYIIHLLNETQKVLRRRQKACVHIVIGLQNSTGQLAECRVQRLQHAL